MLDKFLIKHSNKTQTEPNMKNFPQQVAEKAAFPDFRLEG